MPLVKIRTDYNRGAVTQKLFFDKSRYLKVGEVVDLHQNNQLFKELKQKGLIDTVSKDEAIEQGFIEIDPNYMPNAREMSITHPDFVDMRVKNEAHDIRPSDD